MSVYIITHKKNDSLPVIKGYNTLLVGAYKGHVFGDCFDDTGDNISVKNSNYCELTGLYWLWKNICDDYVGIVHYRRFFSHSFGKKKILQEKEIHKILENYDVILPFCRKLKNTVSEQYCEESGYKEDLDKISKIIKIKYPSYFDAYNYVMNGNKVYFGNMLITSKKVFDEYCVWLFDILFELEKNIDLRKYNDYQKRIYGFLSERLLTVFFIKNNMKIFECGVIATEENWPLYKKILTGGKRNYMYWFQKYL